jgi:3'-phosphoadenosine 5'-phosphosulfate (PAPS) 3'-phosphatase
MDPAIPYRAEVDAAIAAALAAGDAVRDLSDRAAAATYKKVDGSVVTDADLASDRIIRDVIGQRFPDDGILTEEVGDDRTRLAKRRCWIADPIDGTQQFVDRTGDFDVLVALAEDGRVVAAAGLQPTTGRLCVATLGGGAWVRDGEAPFQPVRFEPLPTDAIPRLASTIWFGAPGNLPTLERIAGRLGDGDRDVLTIGFTPRLFLPPRRCDAMIGYREGKPMAEQRMASEWDFAMPDLFVHEAGGVVTDLFGEPYRYNKPRPACGGGLVAAADPATHARVLAAARAEIGLA